MTKVKYEFLITTLWFIVTLSLFLTFEWLLLEAKGIVQPNEFFSQTRVLLFSIFDGFILTAAVFPYLPSPWEKLKTKKEERGRITND